MSALAARVDLIALSEVEQNVIIAALRDREQGDTVDVRAAGSIADRMQFGDEYNDELDEFVRLTLRKRQIDAARRRVTDRLATLEEDLLADYAERGVAGERHAASGKLVSITRKVWAKVARAGDEPTADERDRAADALVAAGLGDYVQRGFNVNSLSAYFRELAQQHDEQQRALPEHERVPLDVADLLPEQLRGAIELTDQPTLSVRS